MKVIPREVVKRKQVSWSREIRNLQASLKLSQIQRNFLIGTILGDASIVANVGGKNYRLQIEQYNKQKGYVWWKYQIFKNWVLKEPSFQARTNSWRFRTITHPVFKEFRTLFYQGSKKIIPDNINEILIHPLSLAVWFMDDGALGPDARGLTLNTHGFSKVENYKLQKCIKNNFNIDTRLHKDKKYWRIYLPSYSALYFRDIIQNNILPEFKYKLSFY